MVSVLSLLGGIVGALVCMIFLICFVDYKVDKIVEDITEIKEKLYTDSVNKK